MTADRDLYDEAEPERAPSSRREPQIFIPLRHGTIYWTMVGDEAIDGPFDKSADAQRSCRGVFGAWVKTVGVTVDARGDYAPG